MANNQNPQNRGGRPGAMTMAMQAVAVKPSGPKVLRIGLIQDGKIVEERVIRKRETVSVGTSEKNQFIVQAGSLPARFELFEVVGGDYILNFTDEMTGRVGPPNSVQKLEQLRKSGAARKSGSSYQVKLNDLSRGSVVIGNVRLLFQFVVPPPVTPRPQLPAAARGGFVKGIDWLFTAFVVFSYMTFFGFVIYLENADWEIEQPISAVPELMARLVFEEPPPPPDEPEPVEQEPTDEGDEPEEVAENTTTTTTTTSESSSESSANNVNSNAEARARIAEQAMASAESLLLGALGEGGALNDVLAGGAVTGNADEILAQAAGVGVASNSGASNLRERSGGGNGSGEGGGLGTLAASMNAGMAAMTSSVMERSVRGRINLQSGGDIGGSGDFDQSIVVRTIRQRLRAITRCYERELGRNPSLAGKVTVEFTIVERGTVSGARATENTTGNAAVASCVTSAVRRFRFRPGPDGGSVTFSYPFVFAPQN